MQEKIFTEGWETQLDLQFFRDLSNQRRAYICSPLKDEDPKEYLLNMYAARAYMLYAKKELGYAAAAPHGYLPMLLSDRNRCERTMAVLFGFEVLERSQVLLVCGNRMSFGMRGEIVYAASLRKEIIVFDKDLFHTVQRLVHAACPPAYSATLLEGHPAMAHPRPQLEY